MNVKPLKNIIMQPIEIRINVTVGVASGLEALLGMLTMRNNQAPVMLREAPAPSPAPSAETAPEPAQPKPEAPAKNGTAVSLEEVRAAMDRARRRIEGEDYKENTTGESYKKWHRPLTDFFKKIAKEISGTTDKPSMLPDDDSRRKFIAWSDAISINSDGELDLDLPVL